MDLGLNLGVLALVAFLATLDTAWACLPPLLPDAGATSDDPARSALGEIAGLTWRVDGIGGTPLPDGVRPFVTIAADGSARGTLVCNRFSTDYAIVGQPLAFGAFMMTRADCGGEGAALEERLAQALASIESFSLGEDGWTLTLETGAGALDLRRVDLF
ncbi:META domain-containing protein [Frigidibacter sp. SD6-1]|uniref:META domain-containing protein n=1 Tax=Frigidibacter sp. SD6-1 TaxID=3032581 RepID=UPI0024DFE7EF|nr:META domain-containing protein [Frigidibacter sp. SD6-1]